MGRVEVEGTALQAHATDEGVTDTMIQGEVSLEGGPGGVAAVLSLHTIGSTTPVTDALRDLVVRSLREESLVVRLDGEDLRTGAGPPIPVLKTARKLPSLKRLPTARPRLLEQGLA